MTPQRHPPTSVADESLRIYNIQTSSVKRRNEKQEEAIDE